MPAPYSAGSIFLQVVPSFRGVPGQIEREAREWGDRMGRGFDENFERHANDSARRVGKKFGDEMERSGRDAGDRFGKGFERETRADRLFKQYGTVASRAGENAGRQFGDGFSRNFERNSAARRLFERLEADAERSGDKAGDKYAGRFHERMRRGIRDAQKEIDALEIKFKDGTARRQLTELQVGLKGLDRNIEVGMDAGKAFIQLGILEAKARELHDKATTLDFRANIGSAIRGMETLRAEIESLSRMDIEPNLKLDPNLGAFRTKLKAAVESAVKELGDEHVDVGVDVQTGPAKRAIADIRARLFQLSDANIGVDLDAAAARAQLAEIAAELEQLQAEHWSIDIDADVAAARANIVSFLAMLSEVDGKHVEVNVDVDGAAKAEAELALLNHEANKTERSMRGLGRSGDDTANSFRAFNIRVLAVAALGPLVIPALGAIAGVLAGLVPLAMVAGAAIGVLVLGLFGVAKAYKAMTAAQQQSTRDMQTSGKAIDSAARQVRDAQQSLADARTAASRAAVQSARRIQEADRGVTSAERSLAEAHKATQRAQEDLTQARKDAADQLKDLGLRVRDNALDQQQAVLDLHQAEADLADARSRGATGDELAGYVLALERAKLRIDQLKLTTKQLSDEQAKWAKGGVEGSDAVTQAQDRLTSAHQAEADAQQQVTDAQQAASDARRDAAQQAHDSAEAVTKAQQSVTDAVDAYSDALDKSSASQDKFDQAMSNLSPTGRAFVKFLDGLRQRMRLLAQISEEGFLPGLSAWIDSIVNRSGPKLTSVIKGISGAIGDMFARFGGSLQGQAFGSLFEMLDRAGPRLLGYLGAALVNLGEGVASFTSAMEPLGDYVGTQLIEITRSFRDWAKGLAGSTGLQDFVDYVERMVPKVGALLKSLFDALINLGRALSPYAEKLTDFLTKAFNAIARMDPVRLAGIAKGILAIVLALQIIFSLTALMKSFAVAAHSMDLTLGAIGTRGKAIAATGGQVGLLALSLGILYSKSELVRDTLNSLFGFFKDIGSWISDHIIKLGDLVGAIALVGAAWKVAALAGAAMVKIGAAITAAAPAMGVMAAGMLSSEAAGTRLMTMMGRLGGALSAVGRAMPLIGIGLGILLIAMQNSAEAEREQVQNLTDWTKATHEGGQKAIDAAKKLKEFKNKISDVQGRLDSLTHAAETGGAGMHFAAAGAQANAKELAKLKGELKQAKDAYDEYWRSLTPIEQAQAVVQQTQNDLTLAVKNYGPASKQAKAASEEYAGAQAALKQLQYDVAAATSGLNQELEDQIGLMQTLGDAELNYEQAASALTDAHKRSTDALKQYGANSKEYKDALLSEEQQERSTADAAQKTMEARYANADATTRQAFGQAAYYLELERQKEIYGELPPRLEELRSSMEGTIDPTVLAAAKFYDLGVKIDGVPDSKTIILDSSTTDDAITKIEALGLKVTKMPDGKFQVVADTADAQAVIDDILKPKTLDVLVAIHDGVNHKAIQQSIAKYGREHLTNSTGVPRAGGGPIWGPGTATSDSIPAWLSNGEYVVKAASVSKYGLGLLDAINAGRYAVGGLVKRGRAAFADGGFAANWGGTISLSGGNPNPLAGLWYDALNQIAMLSGQATNSISGAFTALRDTALSLFGQTTSGVLSKWLPFLTSLQATTGQARDGVGTRVGQLRDNAVSTLTDAVKRMFGQWNLLPGGLLTPVNTIIGKVLNNGLFKAFNAIVGALGLDKKLSIPAIKQVKLAAGGQVPGWSPHDKADNIPAMLTAGEYVHPVDTVDYYGPQFMEAIRHKRIPREAFGFATGGYVAMENVIKRQFPWARITSAYRPGDPGYHGRGQAIDVAGSIPYPAGDSRAQMLLIDRWIADHFRNITELIHTDVGAINLWHGMPHTYNAATQAEHRNHVHWAMAGGLEGGSGLLASLGALLGVASDLLGDPAGFLTKAVEGALKGFDADGSSTKKIMSGGVRKLLDFAVGKVTDFLASAFGADDESFLNIGSGAVQQQVQQVFANHGFTGQAWTDGAWVIQHESGFAPNAQNRTSSASGIGQMVDSTWRIYRPQAAAGYAHMKDAPVAMQADATARYMQERYGGPTGARRFWEANHFYAEGGPVQDIDSATGMVVPDLHDTGGWLMPGLNVIMNRTGRPEPTINPQTLDALQRIAAGDRAGAALIGQYTQQVISSSPREATDELLHQLDAASLGGRYTGGRRG